MANKQKLSEIVVNNVLAFINPFASKTLKKAISVLLKPCCNITVSDVSYDCGEEELTVVLSEAQVSLASLGAYVQVFTDQGTGDFVYVGEADLGADGKTVVINISTADAPVGADQIFKAVIFLPSGNIITTPGVFILALSEEITIPSC